MIPYDVGLLSSLVLMVSARLLSVRAMKTLPSAKKAALVEQLAGLNVYGLVSLVVLLGGFFFLLRYTDTDPQILVWGYLLVAAVLIAINQVLIGRRLRKLDLGPSYMKPYRVSQALSITGICLLFAAIIPQTS